MLEYFFPKTRIKLGRICPLIDKCSSYEPDSVHCNNEQGTPEVVLACYNHMKNQLSIERNLEIKISKRTIENAWKIKNKIGGECSLGMQCKDYNPISHLCKNDRGILYIQETLDCYEQAREILEGQRESLRNRFGD